MKGRHVKPRGWGCAKALLVDVDRDGGDAGERSRYIRDTRCMRYMRYLWMSIEMVVTPGSVKSHNRVKRPALERKER